MEIAVVDFERKIFVDRKTEDVFFVLDSEGGLVAQLEAFFRNLDNNGVGPGDTFFDSLVVEEFGGGK